MVHTPKLYDGIRKLVMQIKGIIEQVQDMNSGDDRRVTILYLIFKPNNQYFTLNLSHSLISAIGMMILGDSDIRNVEFQHNIKNKCICLL